MHADEPENEVLYSSVEILSQTKSRAESRVQLLRSLAARREIKAEALPGLRILYEDARADVNAGLDRLLVELESKGTYESTEPFAQVAERASRRAAEFLNKSDAVIFGAERGGGADAAVKAAGSLLSAFVDIWKTLRGERSERNDKLVDRIGSFKWQSFDQIK